MPIAQTRRTQRGLGPTGHDDDLHLIQMSEVIRADSLVQPIGLNIEPTDRLNQQIIYDLNFCNYFNSLCIPFPFYLS